MFSKHALILALQTVDHNGLHSIEDDHGAHENTLCVFTCVWQEKGLCICVCRGNKLVKCLEEETKKRFVYTN